jgi:transcriptional repressor NrdR
VGPEDGQSDLVARDLRGTGGADGVLDLLGQQLQLLAQQVEDAIRATGAAEVPAHEVGLAILRPLRELDEVAYLRFASVYRSFTSVADFEKEIAELKARQSQAAEPSGSVPTGTLTGA